MKKLIVLAGCLLVATGAVWAGVELTEHDLSGGVSNELCIYCHTPHSGSPAVPLWNHDLSTATYSRYDSPTMDPTGDHDAIWTAGTDISSLCLGCHDGTVGISAFASNGQTDVMLPAAAGYLGTVLTDDHPVHFTYTEDGGENDTLANVQAATTGVQLFGPGEDQVECASCHDPHNDTAGEQPFLVGSNTASAICTTCHLK